MRRDVQRYRLAVRLAMSASSSSTRCSGRVTRPSETALCFQTTMALR